jgi:hypothetical protein
MMSEPVTVDGFVSDVAVVNLLARNTSGRAAILLVITEARPSPIL